jgi:SAM-dependent methyltransferase
MMEAFGPGTATAPYERYYASGHYDRRYPRPNPRVLRFILSALPPAGHVIDFGCGSGRYLLALRDRVAVAAGYDICAAALERLQLSAARLGCADHLLAVGPDPAELDRHVARHGRADVVLCLFGVLSHIESAAARAEALRRMTALLRPGSGRLILSVPNRHRRFRSEQRAQGAADGEIRYVRQLRDMALPMSYKLFDLDSLRTELARAGLQIETLRAESLVPETLVANSPVMRTFDRLTTPLLPAGLGYGILAVARPAALASA